VKIPLSWLREFVKVPGTAVEIGTAMSTRGFAVEGIGSTPEGDQVIDFEVTANRPDCLSVAGMAREIAAAYGLQVLRPAVRSAGREALTPSAVPVDSPVEAAQPAGLYLLSLKPVNGGDIDITIEDSALCPRYAGAVADVTVRDSPAWLQARLRAAGVRPISNIVDVTNYVLIELGQPMHAFDHARLAGGQIRVRTAVRGERIRTIDGQIRDLAPDMLVIADADRPAAVAGVMGGADSEVTGVTSTILLESAYFSPLSVRRTSRRLGLKTEASTRFERGADPRVAVTALERACELLEHIGAGLARGTVVDRTASRIEPRQIRLRRARVSGLLGLEIADAATRHILEGLGFALRDAADGWDVIVPTRRVDILREVDLIEEVARHHGFDRIPALFPPLASPPAAVDPRILEARTLRTTLTGAGFSEAATFGFISGPSAARFAAEDAVVPIANPLSETFAVLRPSLLPGLLDALAYNRRREQHDVRLFEIGSRFSKPAGERRALALAWTGQADRDHWSSRARAVDLFDVMGVVERVADALTLETHTQPAREPWLLPGRSASISSGDQVVGWLGQLLPDIAEHHGLPADDPVYIAEIDLDAEALRARTPFRMHALPRYPSVTRDLSIVVDDALQAEAVRQTIRSAAPPTLIRVHEFDRYQGKGIPDGQVSLSLRLVFRSPDRTLTDAEVQQAMDAVIAALRQRHSAVQR
jgi:phenylalanyl-tRNA synthetase beta chain